MFFAAQAPLKKIPRKREFLAASGGLFICRKIYVSFKIYLKSRQIFFICPR